MVLPRMDMDEALVYGVLTLTLALLVSGRLRYDLVALGALLILTIVGVVPASEAYLGFAHPAVVSVVAVLILSRALQNSGVVDVMSDWFSRVGERLTVQIASLSYSITALSGFMNNVGALSLMMPLAIKIAKNSNRPYSRYLMPLAFASLLGGMTTLIGTPPNIIVSAFRQDATGESFSMFDFTPVGLGIALFGVLFISLIGWRLIPRRQSQGSLGETIRIESYMTEVRVSEDSMFVGKLVRDLEEAINEDVAIVGLIRNGVGYGAPSSYEIVDIGDLLIIEANPDDIQAFLRDTGFTLEGSGDLPSDIDRTVNAEDVVIVEAVVVPNGRVDGRTARSLQMHAAFGVNLLGVSRRGVSLAARVSRVTLKAGDVLLLQGKTELMQSALPRLNLLPLAERDLQVGQSRGMMFPIAAFAGAILLTAFDILPIQISLMTAVALLLASRFLTLQAAYQAIDWPVIVLLGAMIPVGAALETTGGAARIAAAVVDMGGAYPPWAILAVILVVTMLLSAVINNATAVILMSPIGIGVADAIGASVDPFLMAVAIGGSCAFLSPIGHQSNTIVMGPGGYRFGDYWRMGLPLEVIIVAVGVPLIMWFWPLGV